MKWKQGWNGLLISGMLGAGGILMISGGTAAIPGTDYSYAAETAGGTEEGGATSEPESETESETGSEQRTENTGVEETDRGLESNIESESETMQDLSAVEENRRESEESTEGQLQETKVGENGRFEAEAPTTEPEAAEEFETEVSEAETEESEDNETEAPKVAEGTETEIPEVAEEFETEVSEAETEESKDNETEAPTTESETAEEFKTEVSEVETEESEDNETEAPATESETAEEFETEVSEAEIEESEDNETEAPTTESETAEEFETEVSEAEIEESEDNETEAPATESEATEEFETEVSESETEETEETETAIPEETEETETEIPEETEAETDPPQTEPRQPETESQPLQVQRGREYEIRGDENAWFRDDRDRLWVRAGSNVYVQALGTMDYGKGGSVSSVQEDGTLMFQLKQMEPNGQTARVSTLQKENYYVDAEAPAAVISGSGEEQNGVLYAAQAANLQVAIEPDGKSGLKKAAYCIRSSVGRPGSKAAGQQDIWKECTDGQQVAISEEGVWKVYVRTEDQVGNLKFSESAPICVDRTAPEITISGVSDQSANSGSLPIQISCEDAYYRPGSLKIQIHGSNGGKAPALKKSEESEQGCLVEYFDFPKGKGATTIRIPRSGGGK